MTFLIVAYVVVGIVVALGVGVVIYAQAPPRGADVSDHAFVSFLCLLAGTIWPVILTLAGFSGLLLWLVKGIDRVIERRERGRK